jgi:hypothetical protein
MATTQEWCQMARTKWPDLPLDTPVYRSRAKHVIFSVALPLSGDELQHRDFTWDFARADMELHPECYSAERRREIMDKCCPRFGKVQIDLEPVGDHWLGYDPEINVLCVLEN